MKGKSKKWLVRTGSDGQRAKAIADLIAIQASNGNWNYSEYHMGLANGLILAHHILTSAEGDPPFKTTPKVWLKDLPKFDPISVSDAPETPPAPSAKTGQLI